MDFIYNGDFECLISDKGVVSLLDGDMDLLGLSGLEDGQEVKMEYGGKAYSDPDFYMFVSEAGHGEISRTRPRYSDGQTAWDDNKYPWMLLSEGEMRTMGLPLIKGEITGIKLKVNKS